MKALLKKVELPQDSLTILERTANGDREAFRECVESYGELIWALAKKYTASEKEAEAATVEIFRDILRQAARFDSNRCGEDRFIALIAHSRLVKIRRQKGNEEAESLIL